MRKFRNQEKSMSSIQNIYIEPLTLERARAVYLENAHKDFPSDELKPFSMIERLWEQGCYRACGFYEENEGALCAYAFTMAKEDRGALLVDYFAVRSSLRGKGYGTAALALLKEACADYGCIIFEVEDEDAAVSQEEKKARRKRAEFYEKNGVIMTPQKSLAFGVEYRLMVLPLKEENAIEGLNEKLTAIYKKMLPENVFMKEFKLL